MKHFILALIAAVCSTLINAAEMTETQFKQGMNLQDYSVEYRDEKQKPISFVEFVQQLNGKSFSAEKNTGTKKAIVAISAAKSLDQVAQQKPASISALDFSQLRDGDGKPVKNNQQRLTLVSFYFAECAPCIQEIPVLNEFSKQHNDIDVVALTMDDVDTTKKFVQKFGLSWPVVSDAQSWIEKLGVSTYPSMALFDGNGKLLVVEMTHKIGPSKVISSDGLAAWIKRVSKA